MEIIITGASGCMGREAVRHFAKKGIPVIMAVRNLQKGGEVRDAILRDLPGARLELRYIDLCDISTIVAFVEGVEKDYGRGRITHLFNNAGLLAQGFAVSVDGYEKTFATNYLGPYILTRLAVERLGVTNVCSMVSLTVLFGRVYKELLEGKTYRNRFQAYSDSKRALLEFSIELARRHPSIQVNVSDPGIVDTDMIRLGVWFDPVTDLIFRPCINSPSKGVAPALRALEGDRSMCYYVGKKSDRIARRYLEDTSAAWLWEATARRFPGIGL